MLRQQSVVATRQGDKAALQRRADPLLGLRASQHACAQGRGERQCDEARDRNGRRDRDAELAEEAACLVGQER